MALSLLFKWESEDFTSYFNRRLQTLISKGVYDGGTITPSGVGTTALRSSFSAIGFDGTTVYDDSPKSNTYVLNQTTYHCILAKYNPYGFPTTPTLQELLLKDTVYLAYPDINYLIVLAVIVLGAGPTLLSTNISYTARSVVDVLGRSYFRGVVVTSVDLPATTYGFGNRTGDYYVATTDKTIYMWTGAAWEQTLAAGSGSLDASYDSGGAGIGREVDVDSQAVEFNQRILAQRAQDTANAAFRIRKDANPTIHGDVGIDVVMPASRYTCGNLVRELLVDGTFLNREELVNLTGDTITFTRAGVNLWSTNLSQPSAGFFVQLVEIKISAGNLNRGLYIVKTVTANTVTVSNLDGTAVTFTIEIGATASVSFIRHAFGGAKNSFTYSKAAPAASRWSSSYEMLGYYGGSILGGLGTSYSGKTVMWAHGSIEYIYEFCKIKTNAVTRVLTFYETGSIEIDNSAETIVQNAVKATSTSATVPTIYGINNLAGGAVSGYCATGPAIKGVATTGQGVVGEATTGFAIQGTASSTGTGVRGLSTNGYGIYGFSSNSIGIYGAGQVNNGVYGVSGSATYSGVYGVNAQISGMGVKGRASSNYGIGVKGEAPGTDGIGVRGDAVAGLGVVGDTFAAMTAADASYSYEVPVLMSSGHSDWQMGLGSPGWMLETNLNLYWLSTAATCRLFFEVKIPYGAKIIDIEIDWHPIGDNLVLYANRSAMQGYQQNSYVNLGNITSAGILRQIGYFTPGANNTRFDPGGRYLNTPIASSWLSLYVKAVPAGVGSIVYGITVRLESHSISDWNTTKLVP